MAATQGLAVCYLSGGQGGKIMFRYLRQGVSDTPSSGYELKFTGNDSTVAKYLICPVGALVWDAVNTSFRLLLTKNLQAGFPCQAWLLKVTVSLSIATIETLPACRNHWLIEDYYSVDVKKLWLCTQMASLLIVKDTIWATISHFFPHNDDKSFPPDPDNLNNGGICRTKGPSDRDFSVRKDGTPYPDDSYRPAGNWYCGLTNRPNVNLQNEGGGMPGQLALLPSSTRVYGLYYDDDPNSFWLGHAPSNMLTSLTPDGSTTQLWTFLSVKSANLHLYSATLLTVQGTDAKSKPRLYAFCVHKDDSLGDDLGHLSAFSIPLQGKDKEYGELDLPPGTTNFDVGKNYSRFTTTQNSVKTEVVASTRFRLRAVVCDGHLALFYQNKGDVYMWRNKIDANGDIAPNSDMSLVQISTEGGACWLVGACVVPTQSLP